MPSAVAVPREISPLNNVTVLPISAVPCIKGVLSLVNAVVVVITGASGAAVSIVMSIALEMEELPPDLVQQHLLHKFHLFE